ncbi:unnamed protein product [Prunus brigantina]
MIPRDSYLMSLFILMFLFSSKAAYARVSHFSETKQNKGRELLKMNNIHVAKKISPERLHHASTGGHNSCVTPNIFCPPQ